MSDILEKDSQVCVTHLRLDKIIEAFVLGLLFNPPMRGCQNILFAPVILFRFSHFLLIVTCPHERVYLLS